MSEEHDNLYVMAQYEIAAKKHKEQIPFLYTETTINFMAAGDALLAEYKIVEKERNELRWVIKRLEAKND